MANKQTTGDLNEKDLLQKLNQLDAILAAIREAVKVVGQEEVERVILGPHNYKPEQAKAMPVGQHEYPIMKRNEITMKLEDTGLTKDEFQSIQDNAIGLTPTELFNNMLPGVQVEFDDEYDEVGETITSGDVHRAKAIYEQAQKDFDAAMAKQKKLEEEHKAAEAAEQGEANNG